MPRPGLLTALLVLLALPAPARAAVTFGSDLSAPSSIGAAGQCSSLTFTAGSGGPPCAVALVGDATGASAAAPVGGVITQFATREPTSPGPNIQVAFSVMRMAAPQASGTASDARFVASGPTVTLGAGGAIVTATAHVPVLLGDVLAVSNPGSTVAPVSSVLTTGRKLRIFLAADLGVSPISEASLNTSEAGAVEPAIRATIEADADGDGFGDETQDACPANAAKQVAPCVDPAPIPPAGPVPPADTVAPALGNVVISSGKVLFTTSERATIAIRITRLLDGRRKGKRCVRPTRKLARAKRCTRRGPSTTLTKTAGAGASNEPLNTKLLRKGRYEIAITARDAAGNTSRPIFRSLTVKR